MSNFITEIKIKKVRHLENIDIKLGDEKKHLILTGKNGSGKTSVLEKLNNVLASNYTNGYPIIEENGLGVEFSEEDLSFSFSKGYIYTFFETKRRVIFKKPKSIEKINFTLFDEYKVQKINKDFLQYILNLKIEHLFAQLDNDTKVSKKLDDWFKNFENILKKIFNDDSFKIIFDRKNYNFWMERDNRERFDLNSLSDGYSAIIDIVTELILRIENTESKSFDCEGIVLIDEIETHLHVELQKNILPLLTNFFPNIQFIVTTHSPFVLSSIENAVIYDLETHVRVEDLSGHSYESLVDTYFDTDKYSDEVKEKLKRYKELTLKDIDNNLNGKDLREYLKLEMFFENLPKYKNEEIGFQFNRIQQLKLG